MKKLIENPVVSVVVAAYNHEKFILPLLESIMAQTYQNFEIVAINDGSKDNTPKLIDEFAKKYPDRIIFTSQQNIGFVKTINRAFKMCRGKYIAPVGSDDIWLPQKLEEQVKKIEDDPVLSIVYCDIEVMDESGRIYSRFHKSVKPYEGQVTNQLFASNFISGIAVMFKIELFDKYGYWDERYNIACDYEFSLRVSPFVKVGYVKKVLALYRVHSTSSSLGNELTGTETLEIRERFSSSHPSLITKKYRRLGLSNSFFMIAEGYSIKGEMASAANYYLKALTKNPMKWKAFVGLVFTVSGINWYRLKQIIKRKIYSMRATT